MENKGRNLKNIAYAVVGVMTLMVAIIGATFAYFTATASNTAALTGNMATISFDIKVSKVSNVDVVKGGLIPMTNSMVQKAVSNASTKGICVDDNGNAVCQIYKITVINSSTASMFVDGYVTLTGGSGTPTDYPTSPTTMRWAQAFCTESSGTLSTCSTAGTTTTRATEASTSFTWTALGSNGSSQHDTGEILDSFTGTNGVTATGTIQGNSYSLIDTNYIRVSKHTDASKYTQNADVTSALVYNQYLAANDNVAANNEGGDSNDSNTSTTGNQAYVDTQVFYIVVWLSETGTNQTAGSDGDGAFANKDGLNFFSGNVTFNSAQGSEVTATFNGYTAVESDQVADETP